MRVWDSVMHRCRSKRHLASNCVLLTISSVPFHFPFSPLLYSFHFPSFSPFCPSLLSHIRWLCSSLAFSSRRPTDDQLAKLLLCDDCSLIILHHFHLHGSHHSNNLNFTTTNSAESAFSIQRNLSLTGTVFCGSSSNPSYRLLSYTLIEEEPATQIQHG